MNPVTEGRLVLITGGVVIHLGKRLSDALVMPWDQGAIAPALLLSPETRAN